MTTPELLPGAAAVDGSAVVEPQAARTAAKAVAREMPAARRAVCLRAVGRRAVGRRAVGRRAAGSQGLGCGMGGGSSPGALAGGWGGTRVSASGPGQVARNPRLAGISYQVNYSDQNYRK